MGTANLRTPIFVFAPAAAARELSIFYARRPWNSFLFSSFPKGSPAVFDRFRALNLGFVGSGVSAILCDSPPLNSRGIIDFRIESLIPGRQKWKFESAPAYAQMALTDAEDTREDLRSLL